MRTAAPHTSRAPVLLMVGLLGVFFGCGERSHEPATVSPRVVRLDVHGAASSIEVGANTSFGALANLSDGTVVEPERIEWSSSDQAVVVVDELGRATGIAPGEALIAATVDGVRGEAGLKVTALPVATVSIEPAEFELLVGGTRKLVARAYDALGNELQDRAAEWVSSAPDIASVAADGTVLALAPGNVSLRASVGAVLGESSLIVLPEPEPEPVASVVLEPVDGPLFVGSSMRLHAAARDASGAELSGRVFSWSSSDDQLATVTSDGMATGVAAGVVRITVAVEGIEDAIDLEVLVPVDRVVISPASARLVKTATLQLEARALDVDGNQLEDKAIAWASSDPATATVSALGMVMAWGGGTVEIIAQVEGRTAVAEIEVEALRFSSIATGVETTCGIATNGFAYCWGAWPGAEHLYVHSHLPRRLSDSVAFEEVSVAHRHVCARTSGGEVWCQGQNPFGALGDGTQVGSDELVRVAGGISFRAISAGMDYTCGVATDDSAWCWGWGELGNLGDGTSTNSTTPVPVAGGHQFRTLSASRAGSSATTCGVTDASEAWCWGDGMAGQLGDGQLHVSDVPVRAAAPLLLEGVVVSSAAHFPGPPWGPYYSGRACGWTAAGDAYCWGSNDHGQLGDGTQVDSLGPVQVVGGATFARVELPARYATSCGLATGGSVWCWGGDGASLLGIRPTPAPVDSDELFSELSMGYDYGCGRTDAGLVLCWGSNTAGERGYPSHISVPTEPTTVAWQ